MYKYEYTDTFGGEANYSWVRRGSLSWAGYDSTPEGKRAMRCLIREAKAAVGLTGVRCEKEEWGDTIALRPRGLRMVLFINWEDD